MAKAGGAADDWLTGQDEFDEIVVVGSQPSSKSAHSLGEHAQKLMAGSDVYSSTGAHAIFDVAKSGLLVPMQTLVEAFGSEILKSSDEKGMTPAHWCCLRGHKVLLQYIIDMKGLYDDPGKDDIGQRPIHWACVNGHIAIVDILLRYGVSIDALDKKGCTPLIVAAQYGQTMLSAYLISKGARLFLTDKEGDTALHWAAFKGHNELMRLLIYAGLNPHQIDSFGQAPVHLACINGNIISVRELCEQDHVDISIADKKGKTPVALAMGRKHEAIVRYLSKESKKRASILPSFDFVTLLFGPPGNSKLALLFLIASILIVGYPTYFFKCIPVLWSHQEVLHLLFIGLNSIMWLCLYFASTIDPGFIPLNQPDYDLCFKKIAAAEEWKYQGTVNPLSRLCHTCRCVRPMRAKHCRMCNRCVYAFDHHCPYLHNCVGFNNRGWFLGFVTSASVVMVMGEYILFSTVQQSGSDWILVFSIILFGLLCTVSSVVSLVTTANIRINLTTNERVNCERYKYLQDSKGRYYNPYDRGLKRNAMEFFHLLRPRSEEEVEFLNVTVL